MAARCHMLMSCAQTLAAVISATWAGADLACSGHRRLIQISSVCQGASWGLPLLLLRRPRLLIQLPQQLHPLRTEARIVKLCPQLQYRGPVNGTVSAIPDPLKTRLRPSICMVAHTEPYKMVALVHVDATPGGFHGG